MNPLIRGTLPACGAALCCAPSFGQGAWPERPVKPVMPDVPTVADSYKGFEALDWKAIVAPAGTPPEIVKKLNAAVDKALAKAETIAQLQAEGSTPVGGSVESAAKYLKAEHALWGGIVRETGVRPE